MRITPGPWRYGIGSKCHDVYSKDGTKICEVYENLSDRFAIAKVPEMIDLLRKLSIASTRELRQKAEALLKEIEG